MAHHFNEFIATDYGVTEAIILDNLYYWVKQNEAGGNKKHYHRGKYWTFNSASKFTKYFPYFTKRQIEYSLKKLQQKGLISIDMFNQKKYDRTRWYTVTDKTLSYYEQSLLQQCNMSNNADSKRKKHVKKASSDKLQNCNMEITTVLHENHNGVTPIPSVNSSINSDIYMSEKNFLKNDNTNAPTDTKLANKKPRTNFVSNEEVDDVKKPPTLEEIEDLIIAKELKINAKEFYDHYRITNWRTSQGKFLTKENMHFSLATWHTNGFKTGKKEEVVNKAPYHKPIATPEPVSNPIDPQKALDMLKSIGITSPTKGTLRAELLNRSKQHVTDTHQN